MFVPRKTQYALRAVFELAKRGGRRPVKTAAVAKAQAIPPRFLEVILNQLKQTGFVDSRRGNEGGYFLVCSPGDLTVGEVIRFIQGPAHPVDCFMDNPEGNCPLYGNCVFLPVWEKVHEAISNVYDHTTFQDLIDQEVEAHDKHVPCYSI